MNVGKRCGRKSITQAVIHKLMIDCAHQSLSVARLKSGDPLVFGRAGEEMDALRAAGLTFEIVPGITAAFAAAAAIPCSLTDRRAASSILLTSGQHAPALSQPPETETSEPTRVVYMPGRNLTRLADLWHEEGLPDDLPCAVISRAAHPDQQVVQTTLAALGQIQPGPAPVLVIGGLVLSSAPQEEATHSTAAIPPTADPTQIEIDSARR